MTNEEAIKKLEHYRYCLNFQYGWYGKDDDEAIDMAIKALEQTRWIPVSERLPKEDGCYLVTTTGTNNDIIDIAYYTDGIWHKASKIKAWMPLPEPYKAESEEEGE